MKYLQGPVSKRVTINRTIDINRNSVANRELRKLAINPNFLSIKTETPLDWKFCQFTLDLV